MTYYVNRHITQFDGTAKQGSNCTPATGANGLAAVSGGTNVHTGAWVRAKVKPSEETAPTTPGWSLPDLDLAMSRVPTYFAVETGNGWAKLKSYHDAGYYIAVQGDSDVFGDSTCSGAFDGLHCIGVHPAVNGPLWRIDDPICRAARWESPAVIRGYAEKLYYSIAFGVFGRVPVLVWADNVPLGTRVPDPVGARVGRAVLEAGHNYGTFVNVSDVATALDRVGHDYGSVVGAGDVQWLLDWAASH